MSGNASHEGDEIRTFGMSFSHAFQTYTVQYLEHCAHIILSPVWFVRRVENVIK